MASMLVDDIGLYLNAVPPVAVASAAPARPVPVTSPMTSTVLTLAEAAPPALFGSAPPRDRH